MRATICLLLACVAAGSNPATVAALVLTVLWRPKL